MSDQPPNSMTCDHPDAKRIRVFLDGVERRGDVLEYNIPEGWIKKRTISGYGRFARANTSKLFGVVTVAWKES